MKYLLQLWNEPWYFQVLFGYLGLIGLVNLLVLPFVQDLRFTLSSLAYFLVQFPIQISSYILVPIFMVLGWNGKSTIYGNELYPFGVGNGHQVPNPSFWQKYTFMVFRNPVSNLGKWTMPKGLGAPLNAKWPWIVDAPLFGGFYWKYGWATETDNRIESGSRKFYFRPWKKKV